MAEGRMLKAKIAWDKALSRLSCDTYRLLFTWAIPHLDIEGRMSGDPLEFKAQVVPLLSHITEDIILEFFKECHPKLIKRYCVNEDYFLEFPGFKKNQTLRPGKERQSTIPSWRTTVAVQDESRLPPDKEVKEVKISKVNKESAESEKHLPVDNFQSNLEKRLPKLIGEKEPLTPKLPEKKLSLFETLFKENTPFVESLCISVIASDSTFNPYQWITMNKERNADALIHSLKRLKDALQSKVGAAIKSWAYIESVLKDEDKNYNAREFDVRAQKDKNDFKALAADLKALHDKRHAEP